MMRATRSSRLTAPCFANGSWSSPSVLPIAREAAAPPRCPHFGGNGDNTLSLRYHIRAPVDVHDFLCPKPAWVLSRDESRRKFTRSTALPPAIVDLADRRAIFPREPEGGTWIAANDAGVCLALVNWHRIERQPVRSIASRGQVVKALAAKSSDEEISAGLAALPLRRLRPFR